MRNWKTTGSGIAGLLSIWAPTVQHLFAGQPVDWNLVVAGTITAAGLIFAKDGTTNSTQKEVNLATQKAQDAGKE